MITLESSTGADLSVTGKADLLKALGLSVRDRCRQCNGDGGAHDQHRLAWRG